MMQNPQHNSHAHKQPSVTTGANREEAANKEAFYEKNTFRNIQRLPWLFLMAHIKID